MDTLPVLLDTDPGTDIDDALALSYLLRQPRCELLGVTTVTGEAAKRASIAEVLCRAGGRPDVPIHVGAQSPLLIPQKQPEAPHYEALGERWPHRTLGPNTAVSFLHDTILARPGDITLLCIGPLTNIALLFALHPETASKLGQLVLMGGQYFTQGDDPPGAEWNISCDPHAAAIVFKAPLKRITAVGLDVTQECRIAADECRKRFANAEGPLKPVADMAESWFRHVPGITFHDPLAAALIFEPSLCETIFAGVEIELASAPSAGQTLLQPTTAFRSDGAPKRDIASRVHIASRVDVERFFTHYFGVVSG